MKPLIGITTGEVVNNGEAWAPSVYGQAHTYINAVVRAGGTPVLLPLLDDTEALQHLYDLCHGILFSGGNDIDPALYNEERSEFTVNVDCQRDKQELQLFEWAMSDKKPILGICRGMQLLNIVQGGSLYQDLDVDVPTAEDHRLSQLQESFAHIAHGLKVEPESRLAAVLKTTRIGTNALHHQGIKKLGQDLRAVAWAEDGIIEAIEAVSGGSFVIGVQSHPEALEHEVEPRWRNLFVSFVEAVKAS